MKGEALNAEAVAARADDTPAWLLVVVGLFFSGRKRAAFYRFVASYIERRYFVTDALTAIYLQDTDEGERAPRSVIGLIIPSIVADMKMEGASFATALERWAPAGELMALHAFEEAGLSPTTLRYLAASIGATERAANSLRAVFTRLVLGFVGVQALAYGLAYYVLPQVYRGLPPRAVTPSLTTVRDVFDGIAAYGPYFGAVSLGLPVLVAWSLPRWVGPWRERVDRWPVYATYRLWVGSVWLRALAALVAAGMPIPAALHAMAGRGTRYMNYCVDAILEHLTGSLPAAMRLTGTGWPSEDMITALGIFLEGQEPENALQQYADEWLAEGEERIKATLQTISMLGYILVVCAGIWFTLAVQEIMMAFTTM